jgi:N-acyl-D-amino-acid deacylase
MHDLLIRGASVIDGLGRPAFTADVAVDGDRIVEIGRITSSARAVVDADGLALAPGIVDVHTHYDAQLTWESTAQPSTQLGVTTVVTGNCGFGIAPCPPEAREATMANLAVVEGMELETLRAGINWDFEDFASYMALLRRRGAYPNVAVLVGHTMVRTAVMGEDRSKRAARPDEVARMKALVADAMAAGAIGFATSQLPNHHGHGGVPMPSRLAEDDEVIALCQAVGEAGKGVLEITGGERFVGPRLGELARLTGRPAIYVAALHTERVPHRAREILDQCLAAQKEGAEVYAQTSCQPLSMTLSVDDAFFFATNTGWQETHGLDRAALRRLLADPEWRQRFRDGVKPGNNFYGQWDKFEIVQAGRPEHEALVGTTLLELARRKGADPFDAFFDFWLADDLGSRFLLASRNIDEVALAPLLTHEAGLIALSDAGAHSSGLCDAGFGLYLLGHWVREKGLFTLEEGVRHLTSRPADIYRIPNRGRVVVGAQADMMLFDPARIGIGKLRQVRDLPAGGARMTRDPLGMAGTWVNGVKIHDGTSLLEVARNPGMILDDFARAGTQG